MGYKEIKSGWSWWEIRIRY